MSCSFCNLRGHNITTCTDIFIDIHYERIKKMYIDIITRIYPDSIENYTELGKTYINTLFNLKILRAVGVKYLHLNARMNKSQLIPIIWDYFKTRIYYPPPLPEEQQPPELLQRLGIEWGVTPDQIIACPQDAITPGTNQLKVVVVLPFLSFDQPPPV